VALSDDPAAGAGAGYRDGETGRVVVAPSNKTGRDLRGKGRLQYVGGHYLRLAGTGEYFLKAGPDAPETFLAYVDFDGTEKPLLSDDELRYLMINRGNLDPRERREIESHVTHTYRFLEQIPWTRELKGIPLIAWGHHEKLDGSGYPRGVDSASIPVQTRMMTISDIYDALTATDRPYKRAVTAERALDILHDEAKEGHVDPVLLAAFVEAKVFEAGPPADASRAGRRKTPTG